MAVFESIEAIVAGTPADSVIVVDMPIGLPDHIYGDGRSAEQAARTVLRRRRGSVFSIPARVVVETYGGKFSGIDEMIARHKAACDEAEHHSTPPRRFQIQGFCIFTKIMEIDSLLRATPSLAERVIESHPEVAFAVLNDMEMQQPKKRKGRVNPDGMAERRAALLRGGLPEALLALSWPRGAGEDDWLDACVMLLVARRYADGQARSFPDPPGRDAHGLPVGIWA